MLFSTASWAISLFSYVSGMYSTFKVVKGARRTTADEDDQQQQQFHYRNPMLVVDRGGSENEDQVEEKETASINTVTDVSIHVGNRRQAHVGDDDGYAEKIKMKAVLSFWVVLALLTLYEIYIEFVVSWVPFYYWAKCCLQIWIIVPQLKGTEVVYEHVAVPLLDKMKAYDETVVTPKVHSTAVWMVYHAQTLLTSSISSVSSDDQLQAYRAHLAQLDASLVNETLRRSDQNLGIGNGPQVRMLGNVSGSEESYSVVEGKEDNFIFATSSSSSTASMSSNEAARSAWSFASSLMTGAMSRVSKLSEGSRFPSISSNNGDEDGVLDNMRGVHRREDKEGGIENERGSTRLPSLSPPSSPHSQNQASQATARTNQNSRRRSSMAQFVTDAMAVPGELFALLDPGEASSKNGNSSGREGCNNVLDDSEADFEDFMLSQIQGGGERSEGGQIHAEASNRSGQQQQRSRLLRKRSDSLSSNEADEILKLSSGVDDDEDDDIMPLGGREADRLSASLTYVSGSSTGGAAQETRRRDLLRVSPKLRQAAARAAHTSDSGFSAATSPIRNSSMNNNNSSRTQQRMRANGHGRDRSVSPHCRTEHGDTDDHNLSTRYKDSKESEPICIPETPPRALSSPGGASSNVVPGTAPRSSRLPSLSNLFQRLPLSPFTTSNDVTQQDNKLDNNKYGRKRRGDAGSSSRFGSSNSVHRKLHTDDNFSVGSGSGSAVRHGRGDSATDASVVKARQVIVTLPLDVNGDEDRDDTDACEFDFESSSGDDDDDDDDSEYEDVTNGSDVKRKGEAVTKQQPADRALPYNTRLQAARELKAKSVDARRNPKTHLASGGASGTDSGSGSRMRSASPTPRPRSSAASTGLNGSLGGDTRTRSIKTEGLNTHDKNALPVLDSPSSSSLLASARDAQQRWSAPPPLPARTAASSAYVSASNNTTTDVRRMDEMVDVGFGIFPVTLDHSSGSNLYSMSSHKGSSDGELSDDETSVHSADISRSTNTSVNHGSSTRQQRGASSGSGGSGQGEEGVTSPNDLREGKGTARPGWR